MTDRYIAGIDPGVSGAIAIRLAHSPAWQGIHDMPTVSVKRSSRTVNQVDPHGLLALLREAKVCAVFTERQSARITDGVSNAFRTGFNYGVLVTCAAAMAVPLFEMTPTQWKKRLSLVGTDKEGSRMLALRMFPGRAGDLRFKKHHGRAEAMLIAQAGIEMYEGRF